MTIENLKQIAIKYATTKGSRVPLAPDELCNAVVQYFNEFLKITADINTIQVAVTEEGGNIVFTITGNTLDGKAFTPIVITVDHNDFVTDQEFEEFKTNILDSIDSLNNSISEINNTIKNINGTLENNTTDVTNLKNRVDNTETNIAKINSTLENKVDVIKNPISNYVAYVHVNQKDENMTFTESAIKNTLVYRRASDGRFNVSKGASGQNVANMENIADVEAKIPDVSEFATKSEVSKKLDKTGGTINGNLEVSGNINTSFYKVQGAEVIDLDISNNRFNVGNASYSINILSSNRPTVTIGESISNIALKNDIPAYTTVDSVSYDTTNGAIIAYYGAHEIHMPLQAGENVTIAASEDNKKIVISAAGGGGTGDVTAAGNNTFTGVNIFNGQILEFGPDTHFGSNNGNNTVLISNDTTNGYIIKISSGNNYISIVNQYIEIKYDTYYMQLTPIGINFSNSENNTNNIIKFSPVQSQGDLILNMPSKTGEHTLATTDDIPDTSSFVKLADDNTFTGDNNFKGTLSTTKDLIVETARISNRGYTWSFPLKAGTVALTTDIIKEHIYFISFYANSPSEPCHLIGTMMSKNSYGTGQKTNEEFAVMLTDNLYTNSNEGLAAYGRLAEKDILCIYSEDGLSIRCLDEENSEVDLPTVMFFVMETEL